jgi:hypothetical protein
LIAAVVIIVIFVITVGGTAAVSLLLHLYRSPPLLSLFPPLLPIVIVAILHPFPYHICWYLVLLLLLLQLLLLVPITERRAMAELL